MQLALVSKYPPIQGGVASQALATVTELARRDHRVVVVTNADEADERWRHILLPGDTAVLSNSTSDSVRPIVRFSTTTLADETYVPWAQPYLSKLIGQLLRAAEATDPDLILASYIEPYALAAFAVARELDIPFAVRPAGSDLGRLAHHVDLGPAYRAVLEAAVTVLAGADPAHVRRIAPRARISQIALGRLPPYFRDRRPPPNLAAVSDGLRGYLAAHAVPSVLIEQCGRLRGDLDLAKPTILTYGKVGASKGTFDLLAVLTRLAEEGERFNFVAVAAGPSLPLTSLIARLLTCPPLAAQTTLLPPVAPWHVPALIRMSTAVCVLERDFPIAFHAPILPREVLSVGACLVCSGDIARKQYFSKALVADQTAIIVDDPRDHSSLLAAVRSIIHNVAAAREIGARAAVLMSALEDHLPHHPLADLLETLVAPSAQPSRVAGLRI